MAAAAAPSHRIHTIHGSFGASSRYGHAHGHSPLSISSAQASWNRIPNVCAPRRSAYELDSNPVSARTTPASLSSTGLGLGGGLGLGFGGVGAGGPSSASGSRPRRTTISYGSPVPSPTRRAPPPPPAPAERTASALVSSIAQSPALPKTIAIPEMDDPFADSVASAQLDDELTPLPLPPPRSPRSRVSVPSYTMSVSGASSSGSSSVTTPPGLGTPCGPSAQNTRGRLVASVLLSRGSGRPLGVYLRRRLAGEGQTYVKSGLSQLVAAAA